jgi:hypothetical protein
MGNGAEMDDGDFDGSFIGRKSSAEYFEPIRSRGIF